ncbi:MAG: tol-pal system protein YbgF [Halofilum sp. (in: g-proteobacteria)]
MPRVRAVQTGIALGVVLVLCAPVQAAEDPTTEELDRRVRRMENILDSGQLADLIQRTEELEKELRELRGELETQDHRMDELRKRQRNLYEDLDRRIRELEVAGEAKESDDDDDSGEDDSDGGDGDGDDTDTGDSGSGSTASVEGGELSDSDGDSGSDPSDEREAYDAAFGMLKDGRYSEAASAFSDFVEKYPDGPYADNAQYWLGESRYVTREFEEALEAFRKVVSDHPDSGKIPDARLKIGYSLYELDRMDDAREALEEVVKEHDDSAVARLAEDRLLKIKEESE